MTAEQYAELEAAVAELIREVEATANYYREASGWVTDVHGETADVQTVEAAADELDKRLGE